MLGLGRPLTQPKYLQCHSYIVYYIHIYIICTGYFRKKNKVHDCHLYFTFLIWNRASDYNTQTNDLNGHINIPKA